MIDFSSVRGKREYLSISKLAVLFFGLYHKDEGKITIRIKNEGYKDSTKQIEIERTVLLGEMTGFIGALSSCVHISDIDNIFIEIKISNSQVEESVVGEIFVILFLTLLSK